MKLIWKIIVCLSLIANLGLATILFTPLTEFMHRALTTASPPEKSEAIVVLSSAFPFNTEKGLPGLSTLVRLEKGLELYRQGYAPKIIVLGGIEIPAAHKTIARAMQERLQLYGVPESDIIVHDDIRGTWEYYDNLMLLLKKYKDTFDFEKTMFVTSAEQSFRIKKCLAKVLKNPHVVVSEPYEQHLDWGRRFNLFRRVANEMFAAIPLFYINDRF